MTELTQLNHRDMAVGLIRLDRKDVMLISLYCDIKEDPVPDFLKTALDYGEKRGYSILLAADTNAHSSMWGHETNHRTLVSKILYKTMTCSYIMLVGTSHLSAKLANL